MKTKRGAHTGAAKTKRLVLPDRDERKNGREKTPVILQCLWRRRKMGGKLFALKIRRLHAFARKAHSLLYDLTLEIPVRGAIKKGDRLALLGNFDGLYQVLICTRSNGKERALLTRLRLNHERDRK